jgi:hypothetical protein
MSLARSAIAQAEQPAQKGCAFMAADHAAMPSEVQRVLPTALSNMSVSCVDDG